MAKFRYYFSCIRSTTKGNTEGPPPQVGKHDDGTPKSLEFLHCVANASESKELIVAIDVADPGCVLGEGRLGRVYKGFLDNGQEVAVKKFDEQRDSKGEMQMADLTEEIQMLRSIEHPNLIKMIGYCDKGKDRIIVFEFMPLQSLNLHLRDLQPGQKPLDWKTRMKIAEGVAKALEYLHNQRNPPVIYSGLKSTRILLDENYNPKLSDFGCAKHGPKCSYRLIHDKFVRGFGYIGTEYCMTQILTLKSDVFGFGVVLLELISGEKAIEINMRGSGRHSIVTWTEPLIDDITKLSEIADPLMEGQYPYAGLVKALNLAKMCVKEDARDRPNIAEVVTNISMIASSQFDEEVQVITEVDPITPPTMLRCAQAVA